MEEFAPFSSDLFINQYIIALLINQATMNMVNLAEVLLVTDYRGLV